MPSQNQQPRIFLGGDVGGTTFKVAASKYENGQHTLIEGSVVEVPSKVKDGPMNLCNEVIPAGIALSLKQAKLSEKDICAWGLDFPAPIDAQGILLAQSNLGHGDYVGFNVAQELVTKIGRYDPNKVRVYVDNDAAAAMYAMTAQLGPVEGSKNVAGFFIGTGLGGAATMRGINTYRNDGGGSEPGQTLVYAEEGSILWGRQGAPIQRKLEQFVSLVAIERQLEEMDKYGAIPRDHEIFQVSGNENKTVWRARAEKVLGYACKALEEGDLNDFSVRIFALQTKVLGAYLAQMINFSRPDHIFIGGGISELKRVTPQFRDWYRDSVRDWAQNGIVQEIRRVRGFPQFHSPDLGDTAAPYGAAIMAQRQSDAEE